MAHGEKIKKESLIGISGDWLRGMESNHHQRINSTLLDPPATSE